MVSHTSIFPIIVLPSYPAHTYASHLLPLQLLEHCSIICKILNRALNLIYLCFRLCICVPSISESVLNLQHQMAKSSLIVFRILDLTVQSFTSPTVTPTTQSLHTIHFLLTLQQNLSEIPPLSLHVLMFHMLLHR